MNNPQQITNNKLIDLSLPYNPFAAPVNEAKIKTEPLTNPFLEAMKDSANIPTGFPLEHEETLKLYKLW